MTVAGVRSRLRFMPPDFDRAALRATLDNPGPHGFSAPWLWETCRALLAAIDSAERERHDLDSMYQEALQENMDEFDGFAGALGLPDVINPEHPAERPGYQHILDAILTIRSERDTLRAEVARLRGALQESRKCLIAIQVVRAPGKDALQQIVK